MGYSELCLHPQKEYKVKSKILTCECSRRYIQTRVGQKLCFLCMRHTLERYPLLKKINGDRLNNRKQSTL